MAAFVVLATKRPASALNARMKEVFPATAFLQVNEVAWLVSYDGTTRALAEVLGIRQGETDGGVVLRTSAYSGRASPDVWEWLGQASAKGDD